MIDSHHHLWSYNDRDYVWMTSAMGSLRRDYLIPELETVTRASGVSGTIAVQARQTIGETEWLLDLAAKHPLILGVVGWVPLVHPAVSEHLARFALGAKLKAVRHVLHDEPEESYMLRSDFNAGVRLLRTFGLVYDILIFERHLPQALKFVDRHPNQVFVVDHIAKPRIRNGEISPWRERITELARRENVYCKVSGMATEADWNDWNSEELRPYFDVVFEAFGPRRLMFGSDWPVVTLAGGYKKWLEAFCSFTRELSENERTMIESGTAVAVYGLEPRSRPSR